MSTSAPDPGDPQLAVILPAFNEIDGIEHMLTQVRQVLGALDCPTEVLVVDDGSTDGTGARAAGCGARVLSHDLNCGYGAALKTGILSAKAPWILIIDADGSYPASAIPRLWARRDAADMVVGMRALGSSGIKWVRRPGKWILNRLAGYLIGRRIPDLNSGLRVIRRDVVLRYLHLCPAGFSFTSTITLALMATGYRVIYEPISYVPRIGTSKIRAAHFAAFILLVVRAVVLFNPLKVFLPLGAVLFLVGLVKLVQDIILWNLSETAVMAFLAAIVVWAVGLLADMISRLQLQPPWRP